MREQDEHLSSMHGDQYSVMGEHSKGCFMIDICIYSMKNSFLDSCSQNLVSRLRARFAGSYQASAGKIC